MSAPTAPSASQPSGRPRLEAFDPWLRCLRQRGVPFTVDPDLVVEPDRDPLLPTVASFGPLQHRLASRSVFEWPDAARGLAADHATLSVLRAMEQAAEQEPRRLSHRTVWEVGCGTGLLALAAAVRGAQVFATELGPDALVRARRAGDLSGLRVTWHHGSGSEPLATAPAPDLVVANLPHKPSPPALSLPLANDGGEGGTQVQMPLIRHLAHLGPAFGSAIFWQHSLPDHSLLRAWASLGRLRLLAVKRRMLGPAEFGALEPYWIARARVGRGWLGWSEGRPWLAGATWRVDGPRGSQWP